MRSSSIERFEEAFPQSRALAKAAADAIAGGICHDSWLLDPYPVAFVGAEGAQKIDVEGRSLIDLWMGHGALILGHAPPEVTEALELVSHATSHLAGLSPLQIEWARQVCSMVPCAERVRFTASGTEATLLALRVARAVTRRPKILRIDGHFHGWHDEALAGYVDPDSAGLNPTSLEYVSLAPPDDLSTLSETLDSSYAAVILEPGGGSASTLAYDRTFLEALSAMTRQKGCLLIFDEVITGFRVAPGGVQELSGVTPDLAVLGKIVSGGLPGGALVGRADVMSVFAGATLERKNGAITHTGTFNGNPLSAVAGLATLRRLSDGTVQRQITERADRLVRAINEAAIDHHADVRLFNQGSILHLMIGAVNARTPIGPGPHVFALQRHHAEALQTFRRLLLVEGADMHPTHGWLSRAHNDAVCAQLTAVFERVFARLPETPDWPDALHVT